MTAIGATGGTTARLLLDQTLRMAWIVVSMACVGLVAVDSAIRFTGVSNLRTGVPAGWTPTTFAGSLREVGLTPRGYAALGLALEVTTGLIWLLAGLVVVWRGWANRMAGFTAFFLVLFGTSWLIEPARLPDGLRSVSTVLDAVCWTGFAALFFLFPSGQFAPRWLRWPISALLVAGLVIQLDESSTAGSQVAAWVGLLLLPAVAAQVWRYRSVSGPAERRQARWLVFGFSGAVGALILLIGAETVFSVRLPSSSALALELVGQTLGALLFLPIPLAVVIGLTRHGLWDVDLAISRTLVYGGLSVLVAFVYAAAVGTGLVVAGGRGLATSIAVGALVAVLFNPARSAVQRGVNRLVYGDRDEPYHLLSRIGAQLEATVEGGILLQSIVDTLTQHLRLPYAAIAATGSDGAPSLAAQSGTPGDPVIMLALIHHRVPVGELMVRPRRGEETLTKPDRRVLEDLARPIAASVRALTLSDDLQRARERLVLAREEERRHLRRELHDGIGPILAAHRLKVGNARMMLTAGDHEAAMHQLCELELELSRSVDSVRQVAYQLRPPILDELGLVAALHAAANDVGPPPKVSVMVTGTVPDLPAALEVAAYRIAQAALANVLRHAQARSCEIALRIDHALTVTISDDGRGADGGARPGVGMISMRERAEELGGTLVVEAAAGGGTRVIAALPLLGAPA